MKSTTGISNDIESIEFGSFLKKSESVEKNSQKPRWKKVKPQSESTKFSLMKELVREVKENAIKVLAIKKTGEPPVIILEGHGSPNENVVDLLFNLNEEKCNIPVLYLSGYSGVDIDFLEKSLMMSLTDKQRKDLIARISK